ncbi:MAG: hypothetical protein OEY67_07455 [Gammaproteobacteria bacterium]|nr:hypothetical protein [Gammaproteobacteria bacterium]
MKQRLHWKKYFAISLLALFLSTTLSSPVFAKKNSVSLQQATANVKKETGGRILSSETQTRKGKQTHRIKVLLPSGKVQVFFIDANNKR